MSASGTSGSTKEPAAVPFSPAGPPEPRTAFEDRDERNANTQPAATAMSEVSSSNSTSITTAPVQVAMGSILRDPSELPVGVVAKLGHIRLNHTFIGILGLVLLICILGNWGGNAAVGILAIILCFARCGLHNIHPNDPTTCCPGMVQRYLIASGTLLVMTVLNLALNTLSVVYYAKHADVKGNSTEPAPTPVPWHCQSSRCSHEPMERWEQQMFLAFGGVGILASLLLIPCLVFNLYAFATLRDAQRSSSNEVFPPAYVQAQLARQLHSFGPERVHLESTVRACRILSSFQIIFGLILGGASMGSFFVGSFAGMMVLITAYSGCCMYTAGMDPRSVRAGKCCTINCLNPSHGFNIFMCTITLAVSAILFGVWYDDAFNPSRETDRTYIYKVFVAFAIIEMIAALFCIGFSIALMINTSHIKSLLDEIADRPREMQPVVVGSQPQVEVVIATEPICATTANTVHV